MSGPYRLPSGGRVDRARTRRFVFDGHGYEGLAGDTLASALLANGVHLVGRSFKYHRPRGILSSGAEEPNAIVQLRTGARTEPNVRATQAELFDGLIASSQNRWPSLAFDLGGVNNLASKLLPAGFYYKTFMWPAALWMTYERAIRRMAGLGEAPEAADPDRYEKRHVHCDVLVAGGGVAGLSAALAAARAGARVVIADEQLEFGGQTLSEQAEIDGRPAADWIAAAVAELAGMAEVTLLPRTTVIGYYDHNQLTLVERVADHVAKPAAMQPRQRLWHVRAREVVLATGAIERPLVFRDNDRPGVMLAAAARAYANRWAVTPGRRVVVFTNNDDAYRTALDLAAAGIEVPVVIDLRTEARGALPEAARARGIEVLEGTAVVRTHGRLRLHAIDVARLDAAGTGVDGVLRRFECDALAMSGGWTPAVHLFSQSAGKLAWDAPRGLFLPGRSAQRERSAGACAGTFSLAGAITQGLVAGSGAARAAGLGDGAPPRAPAIAEFEERPTRLFWVVPSDAPVGHAGKHFVDFQNDVTAADVRLAAREGYRSVEHLKRYTTAGMGTDQGKTSNMHALAILSEAVGAEIAAVGTTTFRPPYTPVSFGALAGREVFDAWDPLRKTAIDAEHVAAGAVFENVGQWRRPWYYPRAGESMHAAVQREIVATRQAVGIFDASTLGKIDIHGPDAATLLDWMYCNTFRSLEVGRCRYGLMLKEDGMVMDDGVTARLAEQRFHMTTTTGNAARVLAWMEEWLQTEWPHLKVYLASVTEQWAVVALNGPRARDVLAAMGTDIALDDDAFPFMTVRDGRVAGMPARVFRVSFTGEAVAYEINVPARHGAALWRAAMAAGAPHGITPYGTEAMHVLRAEKGFVIVGQETDGTVTPDDLGMGRMVAKGKDFLGKRSLARPDTRRQDRKQLVGLLTENPKDVLPEGAQLVAELKNSPPMIMVGHVTSSYMSANCGRSIALALVKDGRRRLGGTDGGETLYAPLLDGRVLRVRLVEPRFLDADGRWLHG